MHTVDLTSFTTGLDPAASRLIHEREQATDHARTMKDAAQQELDTWLAHGFTPREAVLKAGQAIKAARRAAGLADLTTIAAGR